MEAIQSLQTAYAEAVTSGDAEAWLRSFTDDVMWMPPGEAGFAGKEAVRAWAEPYFEQFDMQEILSANEIEVAGDWAFAVQDYVFLATPKEGGEAAEERGKGIVILRRQPDGSWKIAYSVWNRDHALPGGE
jgi:uncharacterized protein (TIGR02246 family)